MHAHEFAPAWAAAEFLVEQLREHCFRLEIAGSIRRRQPVVKDIEIVALGTRGSVPIAGNLLGERQEIDCLERFLDKVDAGRHHAIVRPKKHAGRTAPWGPRMKKLWVTHGCATYAVDLFQPTRETWGPVLAIRTGPSDFSRLLVTKRTEGGAMPTDMRQHEGRLEQYRDSRWQPLDTPDEAAWFAALGVPLWEPPERTEARLVAWLRDQGITPTKRSCGGDKRPYAPFGAEPRPTVSAVK